MGIRSEIGRYRVSCCRAQDRLHGDNAHLVFNGLTVRHCTHPFLVADPDCGGSALHNDLVLVLRVRSITNSDTGCGS